MKHQSNNASYVALLRGINVGGNNIISMKELKACFEKIGFTNVKTYINSGNIVFESAKKNDAALVKKIETGIKILSGAEIRVLVKSAKEITLICKKIPAKWVTNADMRTDVMFLWKDVDYPTILSEIPNNPKVDRLIYVKGAVIWNLNKKDRNQSRVPKMIGSKFYKNTTGRNSNTARKLLAMMTE